MDQLLSVENLTKRFGAFTANDGITLDVRPGDRLAVLGENGAGKSTMMRMLAGELQPDAGHIVWKGEHVHWRSARDAQMRGIGMVHQHFLLVEPLTAAENIGLGFEPRKGLVMDRRTLSQTVRTLGEETGLVVDPDVRVEDMTVAARQKVEILKALYRRVELLILDEPTASLAPQESADLLKNLRRLSDNGLTMLFVSHKLPEVMALCNRIAVLRAGKLVAILNTEDTNEAELAALLVGGSTASLEDSAAVLGLETAAGSPTPAVAQDGSPVLEVRNLVVRGAEHETGVDGISLVVRPGEIVGLAGVDGNGQAPLADALVGLRKVESGSILLADQDMTRADIAARFRGGLGYLPEDRHQQGMILDFSLAENLLLGQHNRPPYAGRGTLSAVAAERGAEDVIREYDVRTPRAGQGQAAQVVAGMLSGGNQQKFLFGREVGRDPRVLVAYQPTRGLDIGATQMLHDRLRAEAANGRGILLISLDLDEILSLSHRIGVLYKGRIAAELAGAEATRESIGRLMIGGSAS